MSVAAVRRHIRLGEDARARELLGDLPTGPLHQLWEPAERVANCLEVGKLALSLGRTDLALPLLQRAVDLHPDAAEPEGLLGTLYRVLGRPEEAAHHYALALAKDPEETQAEVGQAVLYSLRGNAAAAIAALQERLRRRPDCMVARLALADIQLERGDYAAALGHYEAALDARPDLVACRQGLVRCLKSLPALVLRLSSLTHLESSLDSPDLELEDLAQACVVLLLRQDHLKPWWEGSASAALTPDLLSDEFLIRVLPKAIMADFRIERGLTAMRRRLLLEPAGEWQPLALALALHCHLNEFAYTVEPDERAAVEAHREAWKAGRRDFDRLLALALYIDLRSLDPVPQLEDPRAESLLRVHLEIPAQERAAAERVPSLTGLLPGVSCSVASMYEDNPYPRWRTLQRPIPLPVNCYLELVIPDFQAPAWAQQPRILVAGCGTGRDLLSQAACWRQARFTGLDLSRSSLGHARRMADTLGLDVELYHADLLTLADWDRDFDIIMSSGVLHHLADPGAGLRSLLTRLRPDGLLKLALYSEAGRRAFVAGQQLVREHGLGSDPDGIRRARALIRALPADHPAAGCAFPLDFYYLSGCRDLLMHVQEHRFTLPGISALLESHELEFLGFELSGEERARFDALFPGSDSRRNLAFWEVYERLYPDTFRTMYQFWIRRRGN